MPPPFTGYWMEVSALPERLNEYLNTVEEQIRWKRTRPLLKQELHTHLLDQYDACLENGMEETEAEIETLRQMGDPVTVGQELDQIHRPAPQWGFLAITCILSVLGTLARVMLTDPDYYDTPLKNILALGIGSAALFFCYFMDYTKLAKHTGLIYAATIILGLFALWQSPKLNGISFYTRYVVLLFPCVYALVVYRLRGTDWRGFLLALFAWVPLACIALCTPFMLGFLVLLLTAWLLLLHSVRAGWFSVPRIPMFLTLLAAPVSVLLLLFTSAYRLYRFSIAFHPEQDPLGAGYLALFLRKALTTVSLWGHAAHGEESCEFFLGSDASFLLSTLLHHLGWIPSLVLCGVLACLLLWVLYRCLRQTNMLGRVLAIALLCTLILPMAANLIYNFGITLLSGSLPFFDGRIQMILDMGMMGLLLSVLRHERLPEPSKALFQLPNRPIPRLRIYIKFE